MFPIFSAYGNNQKFLNAEEAIEATTNERIESVWPFLRKKVTTFSKTLKPRERANFDCEDVITELYVILSEKDKSWIPERGRYLTFVGRIVESELCALRDKSRTVHSPRNSNGRMNDYKADEEGGTLTRKKRITAAQIANTCEIANIASNAGETGLVGVIHDSPLDKIEGRENSEWMSSVAAEAIKAALSPLEAIVVGRAFGLWGNMAQSVWDISWDIGVSARLIRSARKSALEKMRKFLLTTNHPDVRRALDEQGPLWTLLESLRKEV